MTQVTPKITAAGQCFGYDVDVRKIASSEAFYRLLLPFQLPTAPQNQQQDHAIASWNKTALPGIKLISPPPLPQAPVNLATPLIQIATMCGFTSVVGTAIIPVPVNSFNNLAFEVAVLSGGVPVP